MNRPTCHFCGALASSHRLSRTPNCEPIPSGRERPYAVLQGRRQIFSEVVIDSPFIVWTTFRWRGPHSAKSWDSLPPRARQTAQFADITQAWLPWFFWRRHHDTSHVVSTKSQGLSRVELIKFTGNSTFGENGAEPTRRTRTSFSQWAQLSLV